MNPGRIWIDGVLDLTFDAEKLDADEIAALAGLATALFDRHGEVLQIDVPVGAQVFRDPSTWLRIPVDEKRALAHVDPASNAREAAANVRAILGEAGR